MQAAYFDDAPTRANILNFLTVQIATLPGLAITRTALAEWLAVLDTRALAKALRHDPAETADALAVAIRRRAAELDPGEAVGDLIADTYPRLAYADRERLRLLTMTVRRLAQENDGQVLDRDLSVEGFGAGEQKRFIAQAQELIAILDGRTVLRDGREITPVTRLAVIGEKIAQRRAAAREGAAR